MKLNNKQIEFLKELKTHFDGVKESEIDQEFEKVESHDSIGRCGCFGAWIAYFYDHKNIFGEHHFSCGQFIFYDKLDIFSDEKPQMNKGINRLFEKHGASQDENYFCINGIFSSIQWDKHPKDVIASILKEQKEWDLADG